MQQKKIGVILLNLGTPESPSIKSVRKYLKEFLMDPFVLDIPWILRSLLVKAVILPFRPKKSSHAYQQIWTEQGSPLALHHNALAQKLQIALGDSYIIKTAMRYGKNDIKTALQELSLSEKDDKLILFPLYPQYAWASSESSLSLAKSLFEKNIPDVTCFSVKPFFAEKGFIECTAKRICQTRDKGFEHFLFSFHGIPVHQTQKKTLPHSGCAEKSSCCDQIRYNNAYCYRAQCFETARKVAEKSNLTPDQYSVSFQSRLGRTPWIKPYTDHFLKDLAQKGIKKLAVCCPSFVADCLETLEEVGIRTKQDWLDIGGTSFELIPCLNSDPDWVQAVANIVKDETHHDPL
jgi:ferrochelatase